MNDLKTMSRGGERVPAWLRLAVFASGAAALAYETLWLRLLTVSMGSPAWALAALLSTFMAGLALGGFLLGRAADRSSAPLKLFAALEAALALYALMTPALFRHLHGPMAALLLVAPTVLMGGTLPVLARYCQAAGSAKDAVSLIYFWNTLGGVAGVLSAGFWLIPALGVSASVRWAALVSAAVALAAWLAARNSPASGALGDRTSGNRQEGAAKGMPLAVLWLLFGLSGLISLAYEVIWTRLLSLVLGSSTYAFTIMLAAFLAGIALGSRLASWLLSGKLGKTPSLGAWGLLQLAVAASGLGLAALYPEVPLVYVRLYAWIGQDQSLFYAAQFGLAFLTLLVPAALMGLSFPWFISMIKSEERGGESVGAAYAANTAGAALGPWLATFLLIPRLGLSGAVLGLALAGLSLAVAAFWLDGRRVWRVLSPWSAAAFLGLWAACPRIPAADIHRGSAEYADKLSVLAKDKSLWRQNAERRELVFAEDGVTASVSVWDNSKDATRSLVINGKADASDGRSDMATQLILGHLPRFLGSLPENGGKALVIGLGSGVSAAALARHPLSSITVVEIEPAVTRAARHFEHVNRGVLRDPRVFVAHEDGRGFLERSGERYDLIVSEPSNLWIAGMSHLFSAEFYSLARARLAPNGVFCQWFHMYRLSSQALLSGLKTASESFPHSQLWSIGGDLFLVASLAPLQADWGGIESRLSSAGTREDLSPWGLADVPTFLARRFMAGSRLEEMARGAVTHTDDRPFLEFESPRGLTDKQAYQRNMELLDSWAEAVSPAVSGAAGREKWVARALLASASPERAERELALVGPRDPWRAGLERDLGHLYLEKRKPARAAEVFRRRARHAPRDPAALLDLARAELEGGERERALKALETFASLLGPETKPSRAVVRARRDLSPAAAYLAVGMGYSWIREGPYAALAFSRVVELDAGLLGRVNMAGENNGAMR